MIKRIILVLLVAILLFGIVDTAYAGGGKVTHRGENGEGNVRRKDHDTIDRSDPGPALQIEVPPYLRPISERTLRSL